jgi:lipopolysaccharide export system permease protein
MTLLDRYVLRQWFRLFFVTALGFPVIGVLINLTDNLKNLLDRGLGPEPILLGYLYQFPEKMFEIIPASVLFATVFTVGTMGRNSELTAAKAGGVSFHRLMLPLYAASIVAAALCLALEELAPVTTERQLQIHGERAGKRAQRYNFVYRAEEGWVYLVRNLDAAASRLKDVVLTRQGTGAARPSLSVSADSATWDSAGTWRLWGGASRVVVDGSTQASFGFQSMTLRALTETPRDLLAEPRKPEEMRYKELGRYINAVESSGSDAEKLRVMQALKLAVPVTCIVIALFGAPLAMTSYRAGSAIGIGISLATTIVFLLMVQLSQALGSGGIVNPTLAAWIPNMVFALTAVVLQLRVRT